jgi:hypothetical protein
MPESRAAALGTICWQHAVELMPRPRRGYCFRARIAQNSARAFSEFYSLHRTIRTARKSLKQNDRGTLYPSQNREALLSLEARNPRLRSSSAKSTSRGFLSRKELECSRRFESQTWNSEGGFSWQLILL